MLHFFRHHKGAFLIFLTVIIVITFTFSGGWQKTSAGMSSPGDQAFTMYGRNFTVGEMQRHQRLFELSRSLGMFQFGMDLVMASYQYQTRDASPIDFTLNLLVLKQQMEELGIHPSDEEIMTGLQALPVFQKEGKFDASQAAMVEESLGAYGFTSADLLEVVKYDIALRRLKELITANYAPSALAAEKRYTSLHQTIKASTVAFPLDTYKKDITVQDEEIAKYFEESKDNFMSAEKRAVQWVFFAEPTGLEEIADVAERNKKQADFIEKVRSFAETTRQPGAKLADLAKTAELPLETAAAFARDTPPEAFAGEPEIVSTLFRMDLETAPLSDPLKSAKGFFIVELTAVEVPQQQELETVKDRVRDILVEQKAKEAMATAVNEARTALTEGLAAGKKLEDLAAELKLSLSDVAEFSPMNPAPDISHAYEIAREAEGAAPNTVSKPVPTETGVLLVVVKDKELRKREDGAETRQNVESSITTMERNQIFNAWFGRRKEEADVRLKFQLG